MLHLLQDTKQTPPIRTLLRNLQISIAAAVMALEHLEHMHHPSSELRPHDEPITQDTRCDPVNLTAISDSPLQHPHRPHLVLTVQAKGSPQPHSCLTGCPPPPRSLKPMHPAQRLGPEGGIRIWPEQHPKLHCHVLRKLLHHSLHALMPSGRSMPHAKFVVPALGG